MAEQTTKTIFSEALEVALDGRTNRWLAEKTGIHESDISKLRRGIFNPTDLQITRISEALNTDFTGKR